MLNLAGEPESSLRSEDPPFQATTQKGQGTKMYRLP